MSPRRSAPRRRRARVGRQKPLPARPTPAETAYRAMQPGEEAAVFALVARVFIEMVAPDYSPEGVRRFLKYAHPESLARRSRQDHFVLVAAADGDLAGMIEVRRLEHVSMLFVDKRRRGIGKELLHRALSVCLEKRPGITSITVNSTPYAVPIYSRMGFRARGPQRTDKGIIHVPMILDLERRA